MKSRRNDSGLFWSLPTLLTVGLLLIAPLLGLLRLSLCRGGGRSGFGIGGFYEPGTWTLDAWRGLFSDSYFSEILGFTLMLGLVVTTICLLLGYPLALAIRDAPRKTKPFLLAAIVLTKLSNLLVTIYGLKLILGDHGPVNDIIPGTSIVPLQNNLTGVIIGKTLLVLPYTVLFLWAGLEQIDSRLSDAARGLGASRWSTFCLVTLPLSLPALTAATLISLIWAFGAFISPYLLGSPQQLTLAVDVQRQMFENLNWPRAAAEGIAMIVCLGLLAAITSTIGRWFQTRAGLKPL